MENSIYLLGSSQTFVGVLATLTILCIGRNANNFMYEVLKDIKSQIVEYTKRIKPIINLDSVKEGTDYRLIFLYSKTDKAKDNKELYDECTNAFSKVDNAKFELQAKLTNWDSNVINFTDAIENKKEQQKGPMFAFAFSIIVFVFDELLRCQYIPFKNELLAILSLFSIFVAIYWIVKWLIFMFKDDNIIEESSSSSYKNNILVKLLKTFVLQKNRIQFFIHLTITFLLLYTFPSYVTKLNVSLMLICFLLICYVPFIIFGLIHMFIQVKNTDAKITMHYVYHFLYMFFLSVFIMLFSKIYISKIFEVVPLQDKMYIFYLKSLSIGVILCVGLVCPFLCTLLKYNMVYIRASIKFANIKIQNYIKAYMLKRIFEKLAKKLPPIN